MIRILAVDDSALMRRVVGEILSAEEDMEVVFARDGVEALAQLAALKPDVVTLDVQMPQLDGLGCLARIMAEQPCPVVMLSSLTEDGAAATLEALDLGAVDFLQKPSGTITLSIDAFAPLLVSKVRAAAGARMRRKRALSPSPVIRAPVRAKRVRSHRVAAQGDDAPGLVLVGVSTGGPPALEILLSALPEDFPWPVVVAQHMPAGFTASLAQRLDRLCAVRVLEVGAPTPLEPGCVYVGRGDADVLISRRASGLVALPAPSDPNHRWHPSVDRMVQSATSHLASERLVGVQLTGMGYDGAEAMAALRAAGGRTVAEAEASAVIWGMPGELVRLGGADVVLPIDEIAAQIVAWVAP